jgi:hypothetical protein
LLGALFDGAWQGFIVRKKMKEKEKIRKAASAFRNTTLVPRHLKGW